MSEDTIVAVDLFCGGLSTALAEACEDLDVDGEQVTASGIVDPVHEPRTVSR